VSLSAHQDDELGRLGTLIRYRDQGHRITTVSVTDGDKGGQHDPTISHAVIAQTRIDEARRMVAELGGRHDCLGVQDGFVFDSRESLLALTEILRVAEADVVLTLPPSDYNNDQVTAGQIAQHAALMSAINVIDTDSPPGSRACRPVMDTIVGLDFQPTHYVDITDQFDEKTRLLRMHASQMRSHPNFTAPGHACGGSWPLSSPAVWRTLRGGLQASSQNPPAEAGPGTSYLMADLVTFLGPVAADNLGRVLPQEHLLINLARVARKYDHYLHDESLAVIEASRFRDAGGSTIVDLTNRNLPSLLPHDICMLPHLHAYGGTGYGFLIELASWRAHAPRASLSSKSTRC
jgi:LmbE family N-acetylglucosaminyl deacetylase